MAESESPVVDSQIDYQIISAILSTDRVAGGFSVDIRNLITDFEIFEHLDKPFLTGKISFNDTYNILQNFDFLGGEKLTLTIKSNIRKETAVEIVKEFYTERIIATQKVNQSSEVIFLRLIESLAVESSIQNVNRSYTGTPTTIIENILQQHLNRGIQVVEDSFQGSMKVIVPNLHPLEAALWIKNRTTNVDGLPYYMYTVFADDDIRLIDLGSMLRKAPINTSYPFIYSQADVQRTDYGQHMIIQNYDYVQTEDLLKQIRKGLVGSKYLFYDTLNAISAEHDFSVDIDAFEPLVDKEYLSKDQPRYNYGPEYKFNEKRFSNYTSNVVSQISSAGTYKGFKTHQQEADIGAHKKKIISGALKNFMTKSPITIQVSGREFIRGDNHYTIGNTIRVLFYDNTPDDPRGGRIDTKKSGDYIIFAARHMFSVESYDVKLLCAKLASYVEDVVKK